MTRSPAWPSRPRGCWRCWRRCRPRSVDGRGPRRPAGRRRADGPALRAAPARAGRTGPLGARPVRRLPARPGFRLPPLMFTDDEAVAVLLGLVAARRLIPSVAGRGVGLGGGQDPPGAARGAQSTSDRTAADRPVHGCGRRRRRRSGPHAAGAGRRRCGPPSRGRGLHRPPRRAHRTDPPPLRPVVHSARWYVVAADAGDDGIRTFRLDRSPRRRRGRARSSSPWGSTRSGTSPPGWPRHRGGTRSRCSWTVSSTTSCSACPRPGRRAGGARPAGWVRLQLRAQRLEWVPALLVGLQRPFVVEAPEELRQEVAAIGRRLLEQQGDPRVLSRTGAWAGGGCASRSAAGTRGRRRAARPRRPPGR